MSIGPKELPRPTAYKRHPTRIPPAENSDMLPLGRYLFCWTLLALATTANAQMTPDQQAELLLNGARRAYNERNYPFATARFREYLQKFGGHKEVNSGRYGLALCLLEGPDKNFTEAITFLQPLSGDKT